MTKYKNKKCLIDGIWFDSMKEGRRYYELLLMKKQGQIEKLELQKKFVLIPVQKMTDGTSERACSYFADFVYKKNGKTVVEDVKGKKTRDYIIKRKLMKHVHNIEIQEI